MTKKVPVYGISEFTEGRQESYFYSNDLPAHLKSHQFVNLPHKHTTYISILFTHGSGEHQIDFDNYQVKPGSIFLLNPGQVHSWQLSEDVNGYVFIHTREFYDSIYLKRKIDEYPFFYLQQNYPVLYVPPEHLGRIEALYREINEEFSADKPYKTYRLESLTDLVYIELSRLYLTVEEYPVHTGSHYIKVRKLLKLIDEHFREKKYPKEYADMMHMSVRHLSRLVHETLNKTTSDLITERIILEAKRMLIHEDPSVSSVADKLGYEDTSYFVRLFKKHTAMSPKEFQKHLTREF